jgi:hypothetical protein
MENNVCGQCKNLKIKVVDGRYYYDTCPRGVRGGKTIQNANRQPACIAFVQENWTEKVEG